MTSHTKSRRRCSSCLYKSPCSTQCAHHQINPLVYSRSCSLSHQLVYARCATSSPVVERSKAYRIPEPSNFFINQPVATRKDIDTPHVDCSVLWRSATTNVADLGIQTSHGDSSDREAQAAEAQISASIYPIRSTIPICPSD